MLLSPLRWLLGNLWTGDIVDLGRLRHPPRELSERIQAALNLAGKCDLLFVHRDAEGQGLETRKCEIHEAVTRCVPPLAIPCIPVIPVRMTEAWFLFDEAAIRRAAQKPRGTAQLSIPDAWDRIPNPKETLFEALRTASERTGRDLKKFAPHQARHFLAEDMVDFSPLRILPAFRQLEEQISNLVSSPSPSRVIPDLSV
jgi:hypothetical protein